MKIGANTDIVLGLILMINLKKSVKNKKGIKKVLKIKKE